MDTNLSQIKESSLKNDLIVNIILERVIPIFLI